MALIEHLPPTGWGDVATRQYLDVRIDGLRERMDARFDATAERIDSRVSESEHRLRAELLDKMASQTRTFVLAMIGAMATFAGVVLAATT